MWVRIDRQDEQLNSSGRPYSDSCIAQAKQNCKLGPYLIRTSENTHGRTF
jgi:hypothetical protein